MRCQIIFVLLILTNISQQQSITYTTDNFVMTLNYQISSQQNLVYTFNITQLISNNLCPSSHLFMIIQFGNLPNNIFKAFLNFTMIQSEQTLITSGMAVLSIDPNGNIKINGNISVGIYCSLCTFDEPYRVRNDKCPSQITPVCLLNTVNPSECNSTVCPCSINTGLHQPFVGCCNSDLTLKYYEFQTYVVPYTIIHSGSVNSTYDMFFSVSNKTNAPTIIEINYTSYLGPCGTNTTFPNNKLTVSQMNICFRQTIDQILPNSSFGLISCNSNPFQITLTCQNNAVAEFSSQPCSFTILPTYGYDQNKLYVEYWLNFGITLTTIFQTTNVCNGSFLSNIKVGMTNLQPTTNRRLLNTRNLKQISVQNTQYQMNNQMLSINIDRETVVRLMSQNQITQPIYQVSNNIHLIIAVCIIVGISIVIFGFGVFKLRQNYRRRRISPNIQNS